MSNWIDWRGRPISDEKARKHTLIGYVGILVCDLAIIGLCTWFLIYLWGSR